MSGLLLITISLGFNANVFANMLTGQVSYYRTYDPDFDEEGTLNITGDAATLLFTEMVAAQKRKAAPDLESRNPKDISLNDVEARIGKNITCVKPPVIENEKLKRDRQGKVIYFVACTILIKDVSMGRVE